MKKILALFLIILLSGCVNKEEPKKIEITMNCKGEITIETVAEGSFLSCKLLNDRYKFMIEEINDDNIEISTDKKGVSASPGILKNEKSWVIEKGEKLIIHTNSTDWQDTVEFSW